MKKSEIKVGGLYRCRISGNFVTARVDAIRETSDYKGRSVTHYDVTNLTTKRRTTFRSAAKFRSEVNPKVADEITKIDRNYDENVKSLQQQLDAKAEQTFRDEEDEADRPFASTAEPQATESPAPDAVVTLAAPAQSAASSTAMAPAPTSAPTSSLASLLASRKTTSQAPHVIVQARAGTGKTTTLVEGLKYMRGLPTRITPSSQQQAVWDQLKLSANAKTVAFVAFNKSIATELQSRVPAGCDAMTMHSMGYKSVQRAFGRCEPNSYVVKDIIADIMGFDLRSLMKDKKGFVILKATEDLVSLCKMNLCDGTDQEELWQLASHYDIDLNGSRDKVFELVPKVLDRCKQPKGKINFDDMIWLPVVLNLPVSQYDLLLVDEAQDLNRCQQALAKRAGKRLVFVGDDRQAIYGFAGADSKSLPRLAEELSGTEVGCVILPLTVTRRCGKAIVDEARQIVPDFEAHEDNGPGLIGNLSYGSGKIEAGKGTYHDLVRDGDFLLCRVNAPLVSQCFRFLRAGRKATIQGRDIGAGLISTIKKLNASSVVELVGKISDWLHKETEKENAKRTPCESKLIALQDRHDCLVCFTEGVETVDAVITKIESVFTDDKKSPGIKLSSVHKAKGLEAERVFFLTPKEGPCPHPMAKSEWQRGQEMNLRYVAITRAIRELYYVS